MKVPDLAKPIVAALKPAAVGAFVLGVGAVNAQLGGALAKRAHPKIAAFAAASPVKEALVDGGAGVALDAGVTVGVGVWKGARVAGLVAPVLLMGTAASAAAPVVAPRIAQLADKVVGMIMPTPGASPGGYVTSHEAGGTLPGGYADSHSLSGTLPGGALVSEHALGGTLPGGGDVASVAAYGGTI